jgi:Tfp pilus assembly protein PilN
VTVGEAIGDLPRLAMGEGAETVGYTSEARSAYARTMRNSEGVTFNHFGAKLAKQKYRAHEVREARRVMAGYSSPVVAERHATGAEIRPHETLRPAAE